MLIRRWCITISAAFVCGCMSPSSSGGDPWPVEEPVADEPPETETPTQTDEVILRGDVSDPHFGGRRDFFAVLPEDDSMLQCVGVEARINIDFPFRAGSETDFVVLPKSLTHTAETLVVEIRNSTDSRVSALQTWVWDSDVGVIWGKRRDGLEMPSFHDAKGLGLYYRPFLSPPVRFYGPDGSVAYCPARGQEDLSLPIEIDIEVRSGGQTVVLPMRAEIGVSRGAVLYDYKEVMN